jgi:DNA adenine methylase
MISTSPLRYPGGKARFTDFIWESIVASGENPTVFVEPFCGGAGASIALLEMGRVPLIALNDVDPLVASFWKIVFGKSRKRRDDIDWLVGNIESTDLSIAEWKRQKALRPSSIREAAWKCLYLNRTSFNGILHKAGPIGGWEQKNRTLEARFNREKLSRRVVELYDMRDQVERVYNTGWRQFCAQYRNNKKSYIYLDPPYYHRAEQLYGYLLNKSTHLSLRNYLIEMTAPWMLSYDDAPEVRSLYSELIGIDGCVIDQTYSAHPMGGASFVGRELFFSNRSLPHKEVVESKQVHIGMSVVGTLNMVAALSDGPIRIPIGSNHAINRYQPSQ